MQHRDGNWEPATITQIGPEPRSYLYTTTNKKVFCRNRKYIQKSWSARYTTTRPTPLLETGTIQQLPQKHIWPSDIHITVDAYTAYFAVIAGIQFISDDNQPISIRTAVVEVTVPPADQNTDAESSSPSCTCPGTTDLTRDLNWGQSGSHWHSHHFTHDQEVPHAAPPDNAPPRRSACKKIKQFCPQTGGYFIIIFPILFSWDPPSCRKTTKSSSDLNVYYYFFSHLSTPLFCLLSLAHSPFYKNALRAIHFCMWFFSISCVFFPLKISPLCSIIFIPSCQRSLFEATGAEKYCWQLQMMLHLMFHTFPFLSYP